MFDPKKLFDMMKNMGDMQKTMTEKLKNQKASGEAGAGMVKVVMNGNDAGTLPVLHFRAPPAFDLDKLWNSMFLVLFFVS